MSIKLFESFLLVCLHLCWNFVYYFILFLHLSDFVCNKFSYSVFIYGLLCSRRVYFWSKSLLRCNIRCLNEFEFTVTVVVLVGSLPIFLRSIKNVINCSIYIQRWKKLKYGQKSTLYIVHYSKAIFSDNHIISNWWESILIFSQLIL